MAEDAGALSDMTPQPAPNPDAQTTVNDFLDYTEFFPSDLVRSLRLIGDLDLTCVDAQQTAHELTAKYGKLPTIPVKERPDPITLRREIAAAVDKAIYCRESSLAEASRLLEVAERHCHRISIIKTKLKALPTPPSRDPTPVPVSPQAARALNRSFDRGPHLRLTFEGGRYGASAGPRPRGDRKSGARPNHARFRSVNSSDVSDAESEVRSTIDLAVTPKKLKLSKEKTLKQPKSRARIPGSGTNVHSSIAGISTSNALARLSPPPPDARPGSRWAPWFKLTEYEMAVLRKKMKKNAVWTPSETMIKKQLDAGRRGQAFYDIEKARCEAKGETIIDEEPAAPSSKSAAPPAVEAPSVAKNLPPSTSANGVSTPMEQLRAVANDDLATVDEDVEPGTTSKVSRRESLRRQAMRDAQDLEDATKRIKEAADNLHLLDFATPTSRRASLARSSNKRKREASPDPTSDTREPSLASQDSDNRPPEPKRPRVLLPSLTHVPASSSSPLTLTPVGPSPASYSPVPSDTVKTTTVSVPLAPAGPSTPKPAAKLYSKAASRHATPAVLSPLAPSFGDSLNSSVAPAPTLPQPTVTAASTRPRRESVAPKAVSPLPVLAQLVKAQKVPTLAPEAVLPAVAQPTRPRSARGHIPTPKAQSEEPKPLEPGEQPTRELRRHSIFSQSAIAAPTRASSRKKPPPKGDITAGEDGQKSVTNVKRAQGNKNKRKHESEPSEEIDPDEPRYCVCDDVSYGQMISCDNHCEKEWFHLDCVDMKEEDIPSRRSKWYCPSCREHLNTTARGTPLVPPPLPGRRGDR